MSSIATRRVVDYSERRLGAIAPRTLDTTARTVELAWTTGAVVRRRRFDWEAWRVEEYDEELVVAPESVRLGRLNNGAPLLEEHGEQRRGLADVLGAVVPGSAVVADGEGRARVQLSARPDVLRWIPDLESGILGKVSVGYRVHAIETLERDGQRPLVRVVDWEPYEVSLVTMAADDGARVRAEERIMSGQIHPPAPPAQAARTPEPAAQIVDLAAARAEGARAEQQRQGDLRRAARIIGLADDDAVLARCLADVSVGIDQARALLLDARAAAADAIPTHGQTRIEVGTEADQKRGLGIYEALCQRCIPGTVRVNPGNPYLGLRAVDLCRVVLEERGASLRGLSSEQIVRRAMRVGDPDRVAMHADANRRSVQAMLESGDRLVTRAPPSYMSSSDLPLLMAAVTETAVLSAYMSAVGPWELLVRRGTLSDALTHNMYKLGEIATFQAVPEGGPIPLTTFGERRETWALTKYGAGVPLTYEMILNDRLDVITEFGPAFGRRARLNEGARFIAALRQASGRGPTMSDSVAWINAAHGNIASGSGIGAPSTTTVQAMIQLLDDQTDEQGARIAPVPRFIVAGSIHEVAIAQLLGDYKPTTKGEVVPPRIKGLEAVILPELNSDATPREWYLFADPNLYDGIRVANLAARPAVYVETEYDASRQSVAHYATHFFGVGFADWRSAALNPVPNP